MARIQLSEGDNRGGNKVIQIDTAEIIKEWYGIVIRSKWSKQICEMQGAV